MSNFVYIIFYILHSNHIETQMVWAIELECIIFSTMFKPGQVEQNFGWMTLTPLLNWSTLG